MKWSLTNHRERGKYIREQPFERRQLPPVHVQSASAPKIPQYNPVGVNTAATTYQGGCGG